MASVSLDSSLYNLYWIMAMPRVPKYLHERSEGWLPSALTFKKKAH